MAERLIISVSGLRGIVGQNLTSAVANDYGCAFGTFLKSSCVDKKRKLSVCIGRDSRPSGPQLQSVVTDALCSVGIDVIDLAVVTTPGISIMVKHLGCAGGVVITASHNPAEYNGIKLLLANGMAPPAADAEKIKNCFLDKKFAFVDAARSGRVLSNDRTDDVHIAKVLAIVDKDAIAAKCFRAALDSVNGAGGRVTKKLLAQLGCHVVPINDEPTGLFPHIPEPTAENLTGLCELVAEKSLQVGFAQDPDADRLAVVDENAAYIGEEYTLAFAARYMFGRATGAAATNLSTSRMIDDIAAAAGGVVYRTPVGEANVAAAMLQHNCIIGGEGNGGVIDLRVAPVRDSLVAIALILQLMADTGNTVSRLVGQIGRYYMSKDKFAADRRQADQIIQDAKKLFADAKIDTTDGCRVDFADAWLHLRPSNTEPVVRLIVEAKDEPTARKYIDAVLDLRKQILS